MFSQAQFVSVAKHNNCHQPKVHPSMTFGKYSEDLINASFIIKT